MKEYIKYPLKDGSLFGSINPKKNWYVYYNAKNEAKGLFENGKEFNTEKNKVRIFDEKVRLIRLFKHMYVESDILKDKTLEDFLNG